MVVNIDFHISFEESFSTQIFVASRILYQAPRYDSCIEQIADPQEHLRTKVSSQTFFLFFSTESQADIVPAFWHALYVASRYVSTYSTVSLQLLLTFSTGNPGTFI